MLTHDPRPATDADELLIPEPVTPSPENSPALPRPSDDQQQPTVPS